MTRAGAAMLDITPPMGTHLSGSGMGNHRPARDVLDPLFAKAVVFEADAQRVALVTLDVTVITEAYARRIRDAAAARHGLDPEAVIVCATQTHSAPSLGQFMLDPDFPISTTPETEYLLGAETPYADFAAEQAVAAVTEAVGALQPVTLGVGRGILGGIAFNRRGIRRDGSVMMPKPAGRERQPLGLVDLCYLEGPIDPEVGVCSVRGNDGRTIAMLLHYTCHPVNVFGHRSTSCAVSADWPGTWSSAMREEHGETCVPLVVNGCCGNINPWHPYEPDAEPDHRSMGAALAEMTRRIAATLTYSEEAAVAARSEHVALPYREIPPARRAEVDAILAESPAPRWGEGPSADVDPAWFRAASTRSVDYCRQRAPVFDCELQVFRVGALAIVGLPGEPFVEGQLAIKTQSPAPFVQVAHMTSRYIGYLPTREAYVRGGHEANEDVTYWAKLAPGALETVVVRVRQAVADLF